MGSVCGASSKRDRLGDVCVSVICDSRKQGSSMWPASIVGMHPKKRLQMPCDRLVSDSIFLCDARLQIRDHTAVHAPTTIASGPAARVLCARHMAAARMLHTHEPRELLGHQAQGHCRLLRKVCASWLYPITYKTYVVDIVNTCHVSIGPPCSNIY